MQESINNFIAVWAKAAHEAWQEAFEVQRSASFDTLFKEDWSPATDWDKRAEQKIIKVLSNAYPNHRLHWEEFWKHNEQSDSKYLWVYDPIDWTWAYLNQETTACTNLALLENWEPIVWVVYNPLTGELFKAGKWVTTKLNWTELPVTKWKELKRWVFNYHMSREFRVQIEKLMKAWENRDIWKLVNQWGSPAYNLANVAKWAHAWFVMWFKNWRKADPWDLAAWMLLVEQAWWQVTDLNWNRIDPLTHSDYLLATTMDSVHDEALEVLSRYWFGR